MTRVFRCLLAAMFGAVLLVGAGAPATAEPAYPTQDPDPFYHPPTELAAMKPGDVVRVRHINSWMYAGTDGWQVAFRSTNSVGHPILGMTTVLMPVGVKNPPLVSYQAIINSLGSQCNPSRSLFNTELADAPGMYLPIGRGWALNIPDHEGPNAAYGAAKLGGLITLDSVRAVKKVTQLGLTNAKTVLVGYSGGGMASAWAAALQPTYAPELHLDGVAAGGIPADHEEMARGLGFNPHPGFGLAFAAAIGLEREYPDRLPVTAQLNNYGMQLRNTLHDGCRRALIFFGLFGSTPQVVKTTALMYDKDALAVLHENSLRYFDAIPTTSMYIWHGRYDSLTPYDAVSEVAHRYCAAGAPVKFVTYEIAEHMTTAAAGFIGAWDYVESRFRGDPPPVGC